MSFNYILAFIFSIILTTIFTKLLIKISKKYNIYDTPNGRKDHKRPISFLGGFAIFSGFYISYGLCYPIEFIKPNYNHTLFMVLFTFLIFGLADDFLSFKANKKFILQFFLIGTFLYNSNIVIQTSTLLGLSKDYWLLNLISSTIVMNIFVNSINLIDGSDGLSSGISILANSFLCYYFISNNEVYYALIACSLLGSILAFFYFNSPPAKIFMGNGGSLFIGMILSILTFKFMNNVNSNIINIISLNQSLKLKIAFSLFAIPSLDLLRVMVYRIYKKRNPFVGDSNHIHHKLKAIGFNSKYTLFLIFSSQFLIFSLSFINYNSNSHFIFMLTITLLYSITILIISQIQNEIKKNSNKLIKYENRKYYKVEVEEFEKSKVELYN